MSGDRRTCIALEDSEVAPQRLKPREERSQSWLRELGGRSGEPAQTWQSFIRCYRFWPLPSLSPATHRRAFGISTPNIQRKCINCVPLLNAPIQGAGGSTDLSKALQSFLAGLVYSSAVRGQ
jgi:hypothetical protein